jgi:hypothetical protein
MGKYGIGFNSQGQWTAYPGVVVTVDPTALDLANQGPTGVVALLATGTGFFPPKQYTLFPSATATPDQYIGAGSDLLVTVKFATQSFSQLGHGAGEVYVVPVNEALPGTFTVKDDQVADVLTLTTLGWGAQFNDTTITIAGSAPAVLTLSLPTTGVNDISESYNIATGASADGRSVAQQLVDDINSRSAIVSAVKVADGSGVFPPVTASPFIGAADGLPAVVNDWMDAIAALSTLQVDAIHVATADPNVWDGLASYCDTHRCRGFIGSDLIRNWNGISNRVASITSLIQEAATVNSPRIMHCGLGMNGYPGKFASARYAALAASLEPSVPMTFKFLDVNAIETRLSKDEAGGVTGLLVNGVSPPMPDASNAFTYRVSRGLSSWTGDDNLYRREQSVLAAVDAIANQMDEAMQAYIGGEGNQGTLGRIGQAVQKVLDDATKPTAAIRINSYDPNIIVAFTSDTVVRVTASITPIPPINWINVNLVLQRTDITVTTEVNLAA